MFGIIANQEIKENLKYIDKIKEYLNKRNISYKIANVYQDKFNNYIYELEKVNFIIALGGDGTILQAVQNSIELNAPIIAFNTGTLGFLAEYNVEDFENILEKIINKHFQLEKRNLIEVYKDNQLIDTSLNDIVVSREGFSRIVSIKASVNNNFINNYNGDGIVVCTATGSTGYNLSLNGPILFPSCNNIVLTPIANHSLFSRTIILSSKDVIEIEILHSRKTQEKEAILTCDGRKNIDLHSGDKLTINSSKNFIEFVKIDSKNFFDICKEKLI